MNGGADARDPLRRALSDLARGGHWRSSDPRGSFHALTEAAAETLGVQRASVWLYDAERARIVCADLYDASSREHASGAEILAASCPRYFDALEHDRTIAADDARVDPRTSEFTEDYLRPLGIASMLDAPILVEGQSVGVVCHEHVGEVRAWSEAEQAFASHIADFAALALETAYRRDAERALGEQRDLLRQALEAAQMGTWIWDMGADEVRWSEEVGPMFGMPRGYAPADVEAYLAQVPAEEVDEVRATIQGAIESPEGAYRVEHRVIHPDGRIRWIEARGHVLRDAAGLPVRMTGTVSDITARRELEEQLRQAHKMDAIGRLAGGVAHDFNNLLTAILGQAELMELSLAPGDAEKREQVTSIRQAAERAAELTQQLLSFARKQPVSLQVIDVGELVSGMGRLLERVIGETVRLELDAGEGRATVRADRGQLEQVLMNLAVNARDAMPDGGLLRIRVGTRTVQSPIAGPTGEVPAGTHAVVEVEDEGQGIDPEILPRIFDPFVTTKGLGRGTGLGLSTCFGIVQAAGGHILVRSALGLGTCFTVLLPLERAQPPRRVARPSPPRGPKGSERILVVEDEDLVRALSRRVLESAGYAVTECASGEEAVEVASTSGLRFDLVMLDVVLPGLRGHDLARALKEAQPDAKLLYVSGYAEDTVSEHGVMTEGVAFVGKPFRREVLLAAVRRLLDLDGA